MEKEVALYRTKLFISINQHYIVTIHSIYDYITKYLLLFTSRTGVNCIKSQNYTATDTVRRATSDRQRPAHPASALRIMGVRGEEERAELDRIEEVLIALRRVIRATDLHSKHLSKTTGLTAPQILLMQAIRNSEGDTTIGDLAGVVSLSQATVTNIIDRLERRGYVFRERSQQDRRKVHACLTEQGLHVLQEAPMPLQDQFARQFSDLHEWEQTMIIAALQRVAHMMDAQHIDASPVLDIGNLDRSQGHDEEPATYPPGAESSRG